MRRSRDRRRICIPRSGSGQWKAAGDLPSRHAASLRSRSMRVSSSRRKFLPITSNSIMAPRRASSISWRISAFWSACPMITRAGSTPSASKIFKVLVAEVATGCLKAAGGRRVGGDGRPADPGSPGHCGGAFLFQAFDDRVGAACFQQPGLDAGILHASCSSLSRNSTRACGLPSRAKSGMYSWV